MTTGTRSARRGPKCGARGHQSGDPCDLPAGWGTDHVGVGQCRKHMGNAPNNVASARRLQALEATRRFGTPIETTAEEALLRELHVTAGEVEFYRSQVARLPPDAMVYGTERATRRRRGDVVEDETVVRSRPNVWVTLLHQAESHHLEVAATIARLGIEARAVEVSREQMLIVEAIISQALWRIAGIRGDDPRVQRELPEIIREIGGPA